MLPNSRAHPVIEQPATFRAWAALPAAGAWDPTPVELAVAGYRTMSLHLSYARGNVGGAFDFQVQVSPYSANQGAGRDWFTQSIYGAGVVAAGTDTASLMQREYLTYQPVAGAVESFVFGPMDIGIAVERLRVVCRESGQIAQPGNVEIVATFGMEA